MTNLSRAEAEERSYWAEFTVNVTFVRAQNDGDYLRVRDLEEAIKELLSEYGAEEVSIDVADREVGE